MAAFNNKFNCSICLNRFTKPRIIDCHHTFCETCLDDYINKFTVDKKIDCPVCGKAICVPENGAQGFAINFYVDDLSEVGRESKKSVGVCELHHEEAMDKFCSDCSLEICCKCMEDHQDHNVEDLQKVQSTLAKEVQQLLQDLEENVSVIYAYADSVKTKLSIYDDTVETCCKQVDKQVQDICHAAKNLGDHFKSQLRTTKMEERTKLVNILEKRDDDIYYIQSSLVYSKELMKDKSVDNSNGVIKRLTKLKRETQCDSVHHDVNPDLNLKQQSLAEDIETDLNIPLFEPNDIKTGLLFQLLGQLSNNVDDGVLEHTFDLGSMKLDSGLWVYSPVEQIKNTRWCLGIYATTYHNLSSMQSETTIGVFCEGEDNIAVFCNFMVDIYLGTQHERHHEATKKFKKGTEYKCPPKIYSMYKPLTIRLRMNRIDNAI